MIPGFSLMKRAWMFVRWCYFQFAIHTCISMLEPGEERVLSEQERPNIFEALTVAAGDSLVDEGLFSLLVAMLLMVSYVTITYLPGHLIMLFSFTRHILGL